MGTRSRGGQSHLFPWNLNLKQNDLNRITKQLNVSLSDVKALKRLFPSSRPPGTPFLLKLAKMDYILSVTAMLNE